MPRRAHAQIGESLLYRPAVSGCCPAALRRKESERRLLGNSGPGPANRRRDAGRALGAKASHLTTACRSWTKPLRPGARFARLPAELARAKSYAAWTKSLKSFLYRERTLRVWNCPALKEWSRPLESEREFRLRLVQASREERDQASRRCEPSTHPSWKRFRNRFAVRTRSWNASRHRRAGRAGMRRLPWAAPCWERFWVARPISKTTVGRADDGRQGCHAGRTTA